MNRTSISLISTFFITILFGTALLRPISTLAQQIELLVIIDDQEPLKVNLLRKGEAMGTSLNPVIGGILPGAILAGTISSRNEKYSQQLQESVGPYKKRHEYLSTILKAGFDNETDKIKLTIRNIRESESMINDKKPNYKTLKKEGWNYVMLIREEAGFSTPSNNLGKLAVSSSLWVSVYDVTNKKRLFKGPFTSFHSQVYEPEKVFEDKSIFLSNYPNVHVQGTQIYFRLSGQNVLHEMAKSYGLESEFPSVSKVLKEYKKKFDYEVHLPNGWKKLPSNNSYIYRNAPKKDRETVGIVTDIDLLIKPLGQNNLSLSEFVELRISRLQDMGYTIQPLDPEIEYLALDEDWVSYIIIHSSGVTSLGLHKIYENEYSVNHQLILLDDNYLDLLKKHKSGFEAYINQSKLVIK